MWNRTMVSVLMVAGSAAGVAAQEVELTLSGGQVADEQGAEHTGLLLSPALRWSEAGSEGRLGGWGALLEGGEVLGGLALEGRSRVAALGPVSLEVAGAGGWNASSAGYQAASGRLSPRVRVEHEGFAASAGPLAGFAGEAVEGEPVQGGWLLFPREEAAPSEFVWRDFQGASADVWGSAGPAGFGGAWTRISSEGLSWDELSASAEVAVGDVGIAGMVGTRLGEAEESWAAGLLTLGVSRRMAVIAEVGRAPSDPLTGRAGGSFATLGLRLRSSPRVDRAEPVVLAAPGVVRLSLRAEPGARVEVAGDWTGWEPRAVPMVEPGLYTVEVRLPPGVHRFHFRVDGEWTVPEGYATEPDGFGGRHAVIRI